MITMQTMLAYHSDESFRARFLDELRWHHDADMLAKGTYGKLFGDQWRGCAVGCSLHSLNRMSGTATGTNFHSRYESELGIQQVLAHLEDRIFEGLPLAAAMAWPLRFSSAIRAGADLSLVWPRFALWLLVDPDAGAIRHARTDRTKAAIRAVGALFERQVSGGSVSLAEWNEARINAYAAYAAADTYAAAAAAAATAYAYAYAYAAAAADADADAYAAAAVAAATAYAGATAYAAARSLSFARQADKLVELLGAA